MTGLPEDWTPKDKEMWTYVEPWLRALLPSKSFDKAELVNEKRAKRHLDELFADSDKRIGIATVRGIFKNTVIRDAGPSGYVDQGEVVFVRPAVKSDVAFSMTALYIIERMFGLTRLDTGIRETTISGLARQINKVGVIQPFIIALMWMPAIIAATELTGAVTILRESIWGDLTTLGANTLTVKFMKSVTPIVMRIIECLDVQYRLDGHLPADLPRWANDPAYDLLPDLVSHVLLDDYYRDKAMDADDVPKDAMDFGERLEEFVNEVMDSVDNMRELRRVEEALMKRKRELQEEIRTLYHEDTMILEGRKKEILNKQLRPVEDDLAVIQARIELLIDGKDRVQFTLARIRWFLILCEMMEDLVVEYDDFENVTGDWKNYHAAYTIVQQLFFKSLLWVVWGLSPLTKAFNWKSGIAIYVDTLGLIQCFETAVASALLPLQIWPITGFVQLTLNREKAYGGDVVGLNDMLGPFMLEKVLGYEREFKKEIADDEKTLREKIKKAVKHLPKSDMHEAKHAGRLEDALVPKRARAEPVRPIPPPPPPPPKQKRNKNLLKKYWD